MRHKQAAAQPKTARPAGKILLALWMLAGGASALAQNQEQQPSEQQMAEERRKFIKSLGWKQGPTTGDLGPEAEIKLPTGYRFIGPADTKTLLEAFGNIVDGSDLGLVAPMDDKLSWFIVFDFSEEGYVKDDDKDKLDAKAMLESIREGNKQANEERKRRGIPPLNLVGWEQPPRYDPATNNLEWALRYESEGTPVVNFNTRRLGRRGVMTANLVVDPDKMTTTLPTFKSLLNGFSYKSGHKYAEFKSGDKISQYGLTALVTGGTLAVALKSGLLQKLWKVIVFVVIAVFAAIGKFFKKIFGRGDATTS